jgi:type IV pilus assembly protein PilW
VALEDLSANLRLAGYGLEPAFVFDFGPLPAVVADRLPPGAVASVAGYACGAPVACRDSTAGGASPDEIVFHYRNPYFVRPITSPPGVNSLTISGPLNAPLEQGQLLQVVCYAGDMYWALVTVGAQVPATAAAVVNVPLEAGNGFEFGHQNQALGDPCFQAVAPAGSAASSPAAVSAAKVFKVERFRYFIQTYDRSGAVVPWGTANGRPHLMLDQGLVQNGAPLLQLVAPDVEDLQLSYVFPRAPAGSQQAGAVQGQALILDPTGIDLAAAAPVYTDRLAAAARQTHHPANIGAVRVSLVVRSPEPDASFGAAAEATVPAAGNRPAVAGPGGYRRYRFDTTVATPNLDVRAPYFPTYSAVPADRLNVDGG